MSKTSIRGSTQINNIKKENTFKMKKLRKVLTMFCLIAFLGITSKPVTVQASSYITNAARSNYSSEAQSDAFTFYADCSWKAQYQGYPGVVTITSSTSGGSGTNTLRFNINANTQSINLSGAIIITNSNGGVLCVTTITQAAKGKETPSNPTNNSSNNNSGQSGNNQSTTQKNYSASITKGENQTFSYEAQTGSITFNVDRSWKAEYQGYPGMVTLSSSASGSKGDGRTLTFCVAKNTQSYAKEGAILIKDASTGTVLCHATIKQNGNNTPPKPVEPTVSLSKSVVTILDYLTDSIQITTNTSWTASSDSKWLHLKKTSGNAGKTNLEFYCDARTDYYRVSRSGYIKIYCNGQLYASLKVVQEQPYFEVPDVEIGTTCWGKYTKGTKYENLKAYKFDRTVYIDYDGHCYNDSEQFIKFDHQTFTHQAIPQDKYICAKGLNGRGDCECVRKYDHHLIKCYFMNFTRQTYYEKPTIDIKTTFYDVKTGKDETITYRITFTKVNYDSCVRNGHPEMTGYTWSTINPDPSQWWNQSGSQGNGPSSGSDNKESGWVTCPRCGTKFYGATATADMQYHYSFAHAINSATFTLTDADEINAFIMEFMRQCGY